MPAKPQIKSFLIADMVIQEKDTNKWSAIGIFDTIHSRRFPCLHYNLGLYICLSDAEGKYNIRVEFCDSSTNKLAVFDKITINVPSKLLTPSFGIQTHDLPIMKPGQYHFDLYFDEEFTGSVPLLVQQIQ